MDRPRIAIGTLVLLALSLVLHPDLVFASAPNEGGDDVLVVPDAAGNLSENNLFVTSAGTMFDVIQVGSAFTPSGSTATPVVMRSTNRGTTWTQWGAVPRAAGERLYLEEALLTEGPNARLHLLYSVESSDPATDGTIRHAWTTHAGSTPTWNVSTPFDDPSIDYRGGDLAVDALDYADYRVYAVAVGYGGATVADLYYARSTDQGATWQPEFVLEAGLSSSFYIRRPHVAWGAGRVHVAWSWGDDSIGGSSTNNGVRYRYATNFGAGPGDFAPMQDLLPANVGPENNPLDLLASHISDDVYLLYATIGFRSGGELWRSIDGGTTWNTANVMTFDADDDMGHLVMNEAGDRLYVSGVRTDATGNPCQGQPVVQRGVLPPASPNLLVNPGFEDPAAGGVEYFGAGDGWLTFGGGTYTVTGAIGTPHTGSQSLKLFGACCSGAYQQFPTTSGESWTGSAWVYNNPSDPLAGGQVAAVNIEWIQADGVTQSAILPFVSNGATTATSPQGVWTYQSIQGTAPADAAYARLTLITADFAPGGPGGAPLYDDASLVRDNPGPAFGAPMVFADHNEDQGIWQVVTGIDPSAPDEIGVSWAANSVVCTPPVGTPLRFDATWRNDPGYPVTEPGFPISLPVSPVGPATVAQLDGDPELEITWLDGFGQLNVVSHDGVAATGFPRFVGIPQYDTAVAAGDLNGDGMASLVVGNAEGVLHALNPLSGEHQPGFPLTLGSSEVRAAVAPVAPPYPRSIVATVGSQVFVVSYRGEILHSWDVGTPITHAPSIGDLDDDDQPDIVVVAGSRIVRLEPGNPSVLLNQVVTNSTISAPVTLVDLSLPGNPAGQRSIVVATNDGFVKAYDYAGIQEWSYDAGTSYTVSAVAAANNRADGQPEIIFTSIDEVHMVRNDGALFVPAFFPQSSGSGGGGFATAPIVNRTDHTSSSIIAGSSVGQVWSWQNLGAISAGWPSDLSSPVTWSPASGDIDVDGANEIVLFAGTDLVVFDVGNPEHENPRNRWAQWGNDAGHSFCFWRVNDELVTGAPPTGSLVSFAPPSPNPAGNRTTFSFSLPVNSDLSLVVYDVRGRRVRVLADGPFPAGAHSLIFDGRDGEGSRVANGVYLAVLRSRSGGVEERQTRRVVLLR